jgi:hypothetical protein
VSDTSEEPGEIPPGDNFLYELILVMLLAATDKVEAYELLLGPDAVDDTDPNVEWKRGTGEMRNVDSRCGWPSSTGGDDARLFCPADILGEYLSGLEE